MPGTGLHITGKINAGKLRAGKIKTEFPGSDPSWEKTSRQVTEKTED